MIYSILQTAPTFRSKGSNDPEKPRLRFTLAKVAVEFGEPGVSFEKGTVYITNKELYFFSEKSQTGFAVKHSNIVLQTVSRQDPNGPCVYLQLSDDLTKTSEVTPETYCELRFSPENLASLDDLALAIADCAPQPKEVYAWEPEKLDEEELLEAAKFSREYLNSILIPTPKKD